MTSQNNSRVDYQSWAISININGLLSPTMALLLLGGNIYFQEKEKDHEGKIELNYLLRKLET